MTTEITLEKAAAPEATAAAPETKKAKKSDKVTIILEEQADGAVQQFFGLNGVGYLIKFGQEVTVPRALLNVLDEAVQTKTIPLPEGGFTERSFKRFPYRIVG